MRGTLGSSATRYGKSMLMERPYVRTYRNPNLGGSVTELSVTGNCQGTHGDNLTLAPPARVLMVISLVFENY